MDENETLITVRRLRGEAIHWLRVDPVAEPDYVFKSALCGAESGDWGWVDGTMTKIPATATCPRCLKRVVKLTKVAA